MVLIAIILVVLLIILGLIVFKMLKNGGIKFLIILIGALAFWYFKLSYSFTVEINTLIVIGLILFSYFLSRILQNELQKMEVRKEKQEKKDIKDKRDELLIRIQDENDDEAKLELGKLYIEKFFEAKKSNLKEESNKLLRQAFTLFDILVEKGNVEGFIYGGRALEKIAQEQEKDGISSYELEEMYSNAAEAYLGTEIDDYIYRAGEIYWKLYNKLKYDKYLKNAKEAYEKIENKNKETKKRLGEIFLIEKSM